MAIQTIHNPLLPQGALKARGAPSVPRPPSRWKTRVLLPLGLVSAAAALLLYAARDVIRPATEVWVVPVISRPAAEGTQPGAQEAGSVVSQAPGWVRPWPYPVTVPALTDGVVREVLVLVGDKVERDQVVARLIDEDARLAERTAAGELAEREADLGRARAELATAEARVAEARNDTERVRAVTTQGSGSEGELARQELRLVAMIRESEAAAAMVKVAEAARDTHLVLCEEAELALSRTEVRAPAAGVVMELAVQPGTRLSMDARGDEMSTAVARLYDPASLQVRVDVPLSDAAKMRVGGAAEVTTEALPDRTLKGEVVLIGHEADIQRNTVPVSVLIAEPPAVLRPGMLTRVRFLGIGGGGAGVASHTGGARLVVHESALGAREGTRVAVWMVDRSDGSGAVARRREVEVGASQGGYVTVVSGLSAGDRLIVDVPAGLVDGTRVRVAGERRTP